MTSTYTQYYGWTKPEIGGAPDQWGNLLNSDLDSIDQTVKTIDQAVATNTDTITSIAPLARAALSKDGSLEGLTDVPASRTNLGLGSAAVHAVSYFLKAGATAVNSSKLQGHPASYFWNPANTRSDFGILSEESSGGAGRAAVKDVQASKTDTTAGRVLLTGAFGWGEPISIDNGNLNNADVGGVYEWAAGTPTNVPDNGPYGALLVLVDTIADVNQLYFSNGGTIWTRRRSGSTWHNWYRLLRHGDTIRADDVTGLDKPLGIGQTWQDFSNFRVNGQTYYNSSDRSIQINVYGETGYHFAQLDLYVQGLRIATSAVDSDSGFVNAFVTAILPPGAAYRFEKANIDSTKVYLLQ